MAEIRDVDEKGDVVESKPQEPVTTGSLLEAPTQDILEVATEQLFGLETSGEKSRYESKVKEIVEWAKGTTDDHTPDGIKWAIRDMQLKIGSPRMGESPVDYLHSYVMLASEKKQIDTKLKKYNPYE
jgi:hypothetical protein